MRALRKSNGEEQKDGERESCKKRERKSDPAFLRRGRGSTINIEHQTLAVSVSKTVFVLELSIVMISQHNNVSVQRK